MDLKECVNILEQKDRLIRIKKEVDPLHELAAVAKKLEGGQAALFEKVKGYSEKIVCGLFWNRDNVAALFSSSTPKLPFVFAGAVKNTDYEKFRPVLSREPKCQEKVFLEPDLYKIPTPTLALGDGGPYYSSSVVIAKDPETGVRNASVHRLMLTGQNRLGLLMDVGRHLRDYYERAEKMGKSLEITINNGVDPAVYFAAITPSSAVAINRDELAVAGFLRERPLELSKSKTVAPEGIADASVVIEGEILPYIREPEGPFGEVTGYYGARENRWVINVKALTTQNKPLIQTLIPGKEVWNSVGLMAEAAIFETVSKAVGGLKNVYLSHGGCGFYHAYIQIDPPKRGMAKNAIMATFAAFPPLQLVTAVNSDIDIFDAEDTGRAMATRFSPDEDLVLIPKCFGHELNPATNGGFGAKLGFDCTVDHKSPEYQRLTFKEVDLSHYLD